MTISLRGIVQSWLGTASYGCHPCTCTPCTSSIAANSENHQRWLRLRWDTQRASESAIQPTQQTHGVTASGIRQHTPTATLSFLEPSRQSPKTLQTPTEKHVQKASRQDRFLYAFAVSKCTRQKTPNAVHGYTATTLLQNYALPRVRHPAVLQPATKISPQTLKQLRNFPTHAQCIFAPVEFAGRSGEASETTTAAPTRQQPHPSVHKYLSEHSDQHSQRCLWESEGAGVARDS